MVKEEEDTPRDITYCATCGYPCYGDKCNMCRLLERFHVEKTIDFDVYGGQP
jgi:hypothetical protein